MTLRNPRAREEYNNATAIMKRATDEAFQVLFDHIRHNTGFKAATDDRAENLVTAIYTYIKESQR